MVLDGAEVGHQKLNTKKNHMVDKAIFLIIVHFDDLFPVLCHFRKAIAPADMNQVQNGILEAGLTEINARNLDPILTPIPTVHETCVMSAPLVSQRTDLY